MALEYNKIQFLKLKQELTAKLQLIANLTDYKNIHTDIEAMQAMTDEILSSSLGILDIVHQKKQRVNIAAVLHDLCTRYQQDGYNVAFMSHVTSAICLGNELVLSRIFENLIVNAIKYGQIARIYLKIQGDSIIITVEDEGPGIPKNEQDKVFEPFYRIDNAATANTRGSGVGLAFTKLAVLIYQGNISLDNRPTRGLHATVTFPTITSKNQAATIMKNSEQMTNSSLANQAYLIKLAALSHDLLNVTTKIRLRTEQLTDAAKKAQIASILDEIDKPMHEILAMSKQQYKSQPTASIDQIAAATTAAAA